MAECRITSFANRDEASDCRPTDSVPEGKVGKVCKEWLVREDGVLAYRLQNEEISQHYEGNRNKNRTVREDLPLAKHLQLNEKDEAAAMRLAYERTLQDLLDADERIARQMQDSIVEQENSQRSIEENDEMLARRLAEKEKARIVRKRLLREKRQVEKLSAQLSSTNNMLKSNCDNSQVMDELSASVDAINLLRDDTNPLSNSDIDLSEFCMQPPPGLSEEELRAFMEEQDAEIARFLQTQESKRKFSVIKDKLAVIESQDYEIAKILQKEEKERIKRLKQKIKQKEMEKQNDNKSNDSIVNDEIYTEYNDNMTNLTQASNYSSADSITYEEPYHLHEYHNIAMDLDPTYKRNSTSNHSSLPLSLHYSSPCDSKDNSLNNTNNDRDIHFAQVYKVSSSNESIPVCADRTAIGEQFIPVPQYLPGPVQGQRRISSDRKRKTKEGCKTH